MSWCCTRQVGASVEQDTAYPGWAPNPDSAVVRLAQEVLTEVTGHKAKVGISRCLAPLHASAVASSIAADPTSSQALAAAVPSTLRHCCNESAPHGSQTLHAP